jgi:NhaP-type Na+/H+ or K+/H+ antiporter
VLILGVFVVGLLAYALASRVLERWSLTPHIVMLTIGIGVGALVVDPATLGFDIGLLHGAGEVALILALFVDAARIDVAALRGTAGLPLRLLAVGLPLTLVSGLVAALLLIPGLTLAEAFLLAALVAPTDASLGAIVVSSRRVPLRVRQTLNVESGLNDGLVTPLVLIAAAVTAAGSDPGQEGTMLGNAVAQMVLGTVAGILVGAGGTLLLRFADARSWILHEARWIAAPAMALLAWVAAHWLGGNAFVAAFVAGLASAATIGRTQDEDLEVGEIGGELLALLTFFLFGVLVPTIGGIDASVIVFAVLALSVVRLVPVGLSLVGTGLSRPSVTFMGWFGPRGLASIVLAIVAIGDGEGPPTFAPIVVAAVVVTVVLSVYVHGLSAGPAVRAYARAVERLPADAPDHGDSIEVRPRRGVAAGGRGAIDRRRAATATSGGAEAKPSGD